MLNVNPYPRKLLSASAALQSAEDNRRAKVPSQRDQDIFRRVEVGCERQCAVAAELRLTPSRVSQIVARVRRWLASGAQGDPQTLATLERRRLERTLAMARQQAIYQRLMREADRQ